MGVRGVRVDVRDRRNASSAGSSWVLSNAGTGSPLPVLHAAAGPDAHPAQPVQTPTGSSQAGTTRRSAQQEEQQYKPAHPLLLPLLLP